MACKGVRIGSRKPHGLPRLGGDRAPPASVPHGRVTGGSSGMIVTERSPESNTEPCYVFHDTPTFFHFFCNYRVSPSLRS